MKKLLPIIIIGAVLVILSISGNFVKVANEQEKGFQQTPYPWWYFSIGWGISWLIYLHLKKWHWRQHPVAWIMGIVPLVAGLYVEVNVTGGIL